MSDLIRMSGWVRKLTDNGTVYYVHRSSGESRWDHPGLSAALESLCKFDNIRYAAYRLSSKLIYLTECLGCTNVPLETLLRVTVHHGIVAPSIILDSQYIREILQDIYNWSNQQRRNSGGSMSSLHAGSTVFSEAMANFIEQVLDPAHQGSVTSLGLKTVMTVFSRARLREKLVYLFREHSHKGLLGQTELTFLLSIISRIPELLGEGIMFGSGVVTQAVHTALKIGGGRGLTEEAWLYWVGHDPPELVWLTTSYRLMSGAGIKHNLACSVCSQPIIGLRYQCLQCLGYDLCQSCFFTGATSRSHRPKHPVQEYCFPSTRSDQMKAMFATLINKFKPSSILKPRKKVTRRLTVDRYDGVQLRSQFRSSLREQRNMIGSCHQPKSNSTNSVPLFNHTSTNSVPLPRRRLTNDLFPPNPSGAAAKPVISSGTSTLTRSDQMRRPVRKTSRSSNSPRDEDLYEGIQVDPGHDGVSPAPHFDEALYHRISPTSSGFCSGSDSQSSDVRSSDEFKTSTKLEKPPRKGRDKPDRKASSTKLKKKISENPVKCTKDDLALVGKSRESIAAELEWDDNGIQLDTDVFADELWLNPGQAFQNSILRQDLDTGEVHVYKEGKNTTRTFDIPMSNDTSKKMSQLQKNLSASRAEIFSIIGHLENDEKRLTAKLRRSPDLEQPITEAQEQLQRLKQMMFNIFGPRQPIPENAELERQLNLSNLGLSQERLEITEEGNGKIPTASCYSPVDVSYHMSGTGGQLAAQRALSMNFTGSSNQVESTHLEAGGFLGSYQTPKTIKTSECLFSPIVFDTDPDQDDSGDMTDFTLTRYQLSDLTTRLGGTYLSQSKDTLLEISEKLKASAVNDDSKSSEEQLNSSGFKEAVDDLEHLMKSLSNLFADFSTSQDGKEGSSGSQDNKEKVSFAEKYNGIRGEPGRVLKIVAQLNQLITHTKESNI